MLTTRGYDPATQTMVIEAIFFGSNSRQQDFVGHSPILSFAKLRLAPDKLRHDKLRDAIRQNRPTLV
jgi:hypothetical protein